MMAGAAAFLQVNVPVYGVPTLSAIGRDVKSMLISEPNVTTDAVEELLPPVVVPPLLSFAAPVVTVTGDVAAAVGVPLTGHAIL